MDHQKLGMELPAKPNNPGNPGKPDGNGDGSDGFPEYPNRESVEETQQRLENIDQYSKRMEDSSSSDSEDEQCPASRFNIYEERQNFVEEMKSKGYSVSDIDCDVERFEELSTNPETGFVDQKSLNEAKTILQSEKENLVVNARRPNLKKGEPNLDFVVDGPGPYKYVDVKNPIDPGKFPGRKTETIPKMSKRIGKKITMQKAGSDKVLHIVDLEQIPDEQKDIVVENVIDGAGSAESIDFIN